MLSTLIAYGIFYDLTKTIFVLVPTQAVSPLKFYLSTHIIQIHSWGFIHLYFHLKWIFFVVLFTLPNEYCRIIHYIDLNDF